MPDVSAQQVTPTTGTAGALKTSRFKVPGEGSSVAISVVTVVLLVALWFAVTNLGLIKPLFLPSPQAVWQQFMEYLTGVANDKPLWQHFAASMLRVFSAFLFACLTAIPVGCAFNPRCTQATDRCRRERPDLLAAGATRAACWLHDATGRKAAA